MRPVRLSAQVFVELPPILAHYLSAGRNQWLDSTPSAGRLTLHDKPGAFVDLEAMAVERRQTIHLLGIDRARAWRFRVGFEQGRRDAQRHSTMFDDNARLVLQAGPVFGQLQGRFVVEPVTFEYDLEARHLYRELLVTSSIEALSHRMACGETHDCACWNTAGYLSGHISEVLGVRVLMLEQTCAARGDAECRLVARLDPEWGPEAGWARQALSLDPVDVELAHRDEKVTEAQKVARRSQEALSRLTRRLKNELLIEELVAEAPCMEPVLGRARTFMGSNVPILLVGEGGTGKESLARAIHAGGRRHNAPFEVLDSAGLPENLVGRELFGYAQGAFPGAVMPYAGAIERAGRGTLFINELCRLPLDIQGRLARAIEEGAFQPLGADEPHSLDLRIMAATRNDPIATMASGELREDLHALLAVGRVDIPPLRDRGLDVLRLAERFLVEFRERYAKPDLTISDDVRQVFEDCAWPGNIQQLRYVVEHAVVLAQEEQISLGDLPDEILTTRTARSTGEMTREVILAALRRSNGNRGRAAALLRIGRTTLWREMKRQGIE